ncbi:MAG TPA: hypothetical protein VFD05_01090 [Bacilli bacterium]|nr:hypothetical protein [Bacilli bacterium]
MYHINITIKRAKKIIIDYGDFDIVLAVPNLNYVQALVDGGSYIYLDINADEDGANIEGEYYKEKVYFESGGGTTGNYKVRAQFRNIPVYLTGTHGRFVRKIAVGGENQVTYIDYINDIAGIPANEIKMSWHHADGFEYAYVIGNMLGSNWTPGVARFQMVPDPKHTWFQWMYETTFKVGDEFSTAKVENDGNIILAPNDNIIIGQNGQYPGKGIVIWQNVFVPPTWGPI